MDSLIRGFIGALVTLSLLAVSPLAQVRKVPPSSGAAWGGITGTLADQTDLQAALDAVTFDQALNTDDDVAFGSISGTGGGTLIVNNGLTVTLGDVRFNDDVNIADGSLRVWQDSAIRIELVEASGTFFSLLRTSGGAVFFGANDYAINVDSATSFSSPITASEINTGVGSSNPINLAPDSDLQINGTPGVTNAAGCAAHTKGICTTSASPDDSPAALRLEIAELRSLIAPLLPTRSRQ